jgi:hypothetical protein
MLMLSIRCLPPLSPLYADYATPLPPPIRRRHYADADAILFFDTPLRRCRFHFSPFSIYALLIFAFMLIVSLAFAILPPIFAIRH